MFPSVLLRILSTVVLPAIIPEISRAVNDAHQTPPNSPLPPSAQEVKSPQVLRDAIQSSPSLQEEIAPKPWYLSRTLWGSAIAIIAPMVAIATGYTIDEQLQLSIVDVIMAGGSMLAGVITAVGRIRAKKEIA